MALRMNGLRYEKERPQKSLGRETTTGEEVGEIFYSHEYIHLHESERAAAAARPPGADTHGNELFL